MAKAIALTPDTLKAPQVTPRAATPARSQAATPVAAPVAPAPVPRAAKPKVEHVPLQMRVTKEEARAIKRAALDADQSIGEFMLACFHAHMKTRGTA